MADDAPKLSIQLEDGVSTLAREAWDTLVGDESPFLEWSFLASLEDAGTLDDRSGWDARPLVAREDGEIVAACPLYLKSNSEGEFVFDWSWADAAYRAGIDYYPKLLVGVPFSPVTGARFLVAPGRDRALWTDRLGAALREICASNELSSVHVNFCQPGTRPARSSPWASTPASVSSTTGTTAVTRPSTTTWPISAASGATRSGASEGRWTLRA